MRAVHPCLLLILVVVGCDRCGVVDDSTMDDDTGGDTAADTLPPCDGPAASEDWDRDLLHMDLAVDLDDLTAQATLTVAASASTGLSLEVQGLVVTRVALDGCAPDWTVSDGSLHVGLPAGDEDLVVTVDYGFAVQSDYDGWLARDLTFTWPYFCGNLFPCHSDPADGLTMALSIATQQEGQVVVYPETIPSDAPSYQLAWARGLYERLALGTTAGGVELEVWYLSGYLDAATQGTEHLLPAWEWLEATMGPYPFGERAGAVQADWGPGGYGGMEHHPLSHVGTPSMGDRVTQIHEAAHGWFGGGVRIACWEDFVLSEGTVTYLTARAITEVIGAEAGAETWAEYDDALAWSLEHEDVSAWPDSCGEVDILDDGLFSYAPYYRGAEFYRRYAEAVGVELLDEALGSFFHQHANQATTMQAMIDHLHLECGEDPMPLAEAWLR
jgi:aminopeptidase N